LRYSRRNNESGMLVIGATISLVIGIILLCIGFVFISNQEAAKKGQITYGEVLKQFPPENANNLFTNTVFARGNEILF
jgi:hypothetical protein